MPRGQNNAAKTHCPRNHEYTEENTAYYGDKDHDIVGYGCRRCGVATDDIIPDSDCPRAPGVKRHCRKCARANAVVQNLKRYGATPETLRAMLEEQEYTCKICSRSLLEFTPHFDHDHKCCPGRTSCGDCVRGLLCVDCNRGLGSFKDNPWILIEAARYLQRL